MEHHLHKEVTPTAIDPGHQVRQTVYRAAADALDDVRWMFGVFALVAILISMLVGARLVTLQHDVDAIDLRGHHWPHPCTDRGVVRR